MMTSLKAIESVGKIQRCFDQAGLFMSHPPSVSVPFLLEFFSDRAAGLAHLGLC